MIQQLVGLKDKWEAIHRGDAVSITLLRMSPWQGTDRVDIRSDFANFLDRNDHTFVPAAIRAAVRVLYAHDVQGLYEIGVSENILTIRPVK